MTNEVVPMGTDEDDGRVDADRSRARARDGSRHTDATTDVAASAGAADTDPETETEPGEPGARAGDGPADTDTTTDTDADPAAPESVQASLEAATEAAELLDGSAGESERDRGHDDGQDWGWREYLRASGWAGLLVVGLAVALIVASGGLPIVATVTSESMAPNINQGDLVVLDTHSAVVPVIGSETKVVTAATAREQDTRSFNEYGSVIMFDVPASETPILHRAHLEVAEGENWVPRANASYLAGQDCGSIEYCPAPHDGIITKGDRNNEYDQVNGIAPPVRDEWIRGVARSRGLPVLGSAPPWTPFLPSPAARP